MTKLLYSSETWTVYQRHAAKLNRFHTTHLRKLLGIKWQYKIPDTEVLALAGLSSIHTLLKHLNSEAGHWLECQTIGNPRNCCLPSSITESAPLVDLKRTINKHWKDPSSLSLNPDTWEQAAQNRREWCAALHHGSKNSRKRENHCR